MYYEFFKPLTDFLQKLNNDNRANQKQIENKIAFFVNVENI